MFLPLDERPINTQYPRLLAAALGWRLHAPEELLGSRKRPGDTRAIADWLLHEADASSGGGGAVGAVLALDTLAWGGLIPSRQSGNDLRTALVRVETLRELKRQHPHMPLLAYSSIQRISRDDDDGEEPPYFKTFGKRIFRRSVLQHRAAEDALTDGEADELARLERAIPEDVWDDVLAIRARTHAVNLAALDLVEEGVLDTLVLNQDDTTTWGLNVQDRARLEREVRRRRLGARVLVYPGADEVAQVLMARLASRVHRRRWKVAATFSAREGASVQTAYEDRPLGDVVTTYLRAAGAVVAPPQVAPDWFLAVNGPSRAQGQGGVAYWLEHDEHGLLSADERAWIEADEAKVHGLDRSIEAFVDTIAMLIDEGRRVSVADVAHVNGGDDEVMSALHAAGALPLLAGYGGWNTAGNALGSAVALGAIASFGGDANARELATAARYLDDWLYQARVRSRLLLQPDIRPLGLGGFLADERLPEVEAMARDWLNEELRERAMPYRVASLTLPWRRVFEIGYELERVQEKHEAAP